MVEHLHLKALTKQILPVLAAGAVGSGLFGCSNPKMDSLDRYRVIDNSGAVQTNLNDQMRAGLFNTPGIPLNANDQPGAPELAALFEKSLDTSFPGKIVAAVIGVGSFGQQNILVRYPDPDGKNGVSYDLIEKSIHRPAADRIARRIDASLEQKLVLATNFPRAYTKELDRTGDGLFQKATRDVLFYPGINLYGTNDPMVVHARQSIFDGNYIDFNGGDHLGFAFATQTMVDHAITAPPESWGIVPGSFKRDGSNNLPWGLLNTIYADNAARQRGRNNPSLPSKLLER